MKISLNWLKDYLDLGDRSPEEIGELLTDIGLEVEGMEEVESIPGGLQGLLIGEVKRCERHPNADKLSVTEVEVGSGQPLHIVCGAPNIAVGQKVVVAPVGATLYPIEGEPFKIKKGKIRGEVSEGMICAEDEIGLGPDHEGILVLPEEAPVGAAVRDFLGVKTDVVYDIGLTPNRSDATSHLGVAKDLYAALKVRFDYEKKLHLPDVSAFRVGEQRLPIRIEVENAEACPRYAGLVLSGVKVVESPDWLKERLLAIGQRPIHAVVDVTNFVLHELGQPLHAFDYDKIPGGAIRVKNLPKGTAFTTLDEQERSLHEEDLVICGDDNTPLCLAGVFGGLNSGVTEKTVNVFLESAHFASKSIRRTSLRHQLRTDAAYVFEKGSDPAMVIFALKRAALLLKEITGAQIASEIIDWYPQPIEPARVRLNYAYVNRLIGEDLPRERVHNILAALEMKVLEDDGQTFELAVPTNKSDVTRPADVVEEILRIHGFNEVPLPGHIKLPLVYSPYPDERRLQQAAAAYLTAQGFCEMMALSFSQSRYYPELIPIPEEELVYINNTSNVHLNVMRPDMLISGLEAVLHNQNHRQTDVKLFEFGRTYRKEEKGKYREEGHLTLLMTGYKHQRSWLKAREEVNFYTLKAHVNNLLQRLGLTSWQSTKADDSRFAFGLKYHRGPQELAVLGRVKTDLLRKMDIRQPVFFADLHWEHLAKAAKKSAVKTQEITKFPAVRRDLAVVVDEAVKFEELATLARKVGKKLITSINLFDCYEDRERLGQGKKSYALSFVFEAPDKTLKDKEVDKVMNQLIRLYEQEFKAVIRR